MQSNQRHLQQTAIVILNWNGKHFLEKFLPGIIEYSNDAEIWVADNASTDDSIDFLSKQYPDIKLLINKSNLGFAGGYNEALKQIDARYYVILNSDIEVTKGWLEPLIDLLENNNQIVACQPKLLDFNKREHFEYAGASGGFIDRYGFPFCRGRIFMQLENDQGQYNDPIPVFWASGACLVIRSDSFHAIGGFDESFFAHMEEIDLCWRLHNNGGQIFCVPSSTIFHIGGGTLPKKNSRKTYLNFRNNYLILYKNYPRKHLRLILTFRLFFDWFAAMHFLLSGHWGDFCAVFKAQRDFYLKRKNYREKRSTLTHKLPALIYRKSIVMKHYLSRIKKYSELSQDHFTK